MDSKAHLKQVINSLINEDDASATAAFKQYATAKARSIVEAEDSTKKVEKLSAKKKNPDCTDEEAVKELINKSNADD